MTWIVNWNGREYDVDPLTFSGLELSEIKLRTSFTFRKLIIEGIPDMDPDAIRALFWTVDRRSDPDLKFSEYGGPPAEVWLPTLPSFADSAAALADGLGKAMPTTPTTETTGTPSSPSSTPPPSTEPSTTG